MKNSIKFLLQKIFGFKNYLFVFSWFKINTLKFDKKEKDFFFFLKQIPKNSVVLDIGANIGIMTAHLAKSKKKLRVFAFEPIPNNIHVLKKICAFYQLSQVEIMEMALGNENGQADMVMPVISNTKMQGLSHIIHDSITEFNEGITYKVTIKKLDDIELLNALNQGEISAIKMDVENFEYFVLEGARKLLLKHKPIIYTELWENENRTKCIDLLESLGYTTHVLQNNQMHIYKRDKHKAQNFIFLVKEKKA